MDSIRDPEVVVATAPVEVAETVERAPEGAVKVAAAVSETEQPAETAAAKPEETAAAEPEETATAEPEETAAAEPEETATTAAATAVKDASTATAATHAVSIPSHTHESEASATTETEAMEESPITTGLAPAAETAMPSALPLTPEPEVLEAEPTVESEAKPETEPEAKSEAQSESSEAEPETESEPRLESVPSPFDAPATKLSAVTSTIEEPISPTTVPASLAKAYSSISGGAKSDRSDEHDSLVTVRLSEPPTLTVDTSSSLADSPVGQLVRSGTMPTLSEADEAGDGSRGALDSEQDEADEEDEVNWAQLQQTEHEESNGQSADNTAMLLARLEQENAKLATNPKSVKVQGQGRDTLELQPPPPSQMAASSPRRPRPPSMAQLRELVQGPTPPALRYSMLPPPPLTELEFYAALVQDYQQTAARLPTLLANKIRKGIPPPLRGVVWQGMTGATRDPTLADQFDRLSGASSPYEGIISKDLGRSFPGVEMFRDPEGDGQRMLGRVLKCYSLYESRIGYCQGLAFLVGPLLMHMPDREAFCVLVKLMENYDLRSSYMPDLAGLHVRIYQFRELLRATLPELSAHLERLQVDAAAYVSQWFLSFFAVTCPLPMLFRMYDVIFAEGAAETIMRVALSLMQKNQARLLACAELEDAMQLLLSRGLWDCYHYNADEFVLHFLALSSEVTRDRLASLDQAYREAQIANTNITGSANVDRSSVITTAASRFLGRLWASSSSSSSPTSATVATFSSLSSSSSAPLSAASVAAPNSSSSSSSSSLTPSPSSHSLSSPPSSSPSGSTAPGGLSSGLSAPLRPLSMLRRSTSKQSLTSTLNSMEASSSSSSSASVSSSSILSSTSTDATSVSRHSSSVELHGAAKSANNSSHGANSTNGAAAAAQNKLADSQIEDLLMALGDLQRQHAVLADQLQREQENRSEDRKVARALLQSLRSRAEEEVANDTDDTKARAVLLEEAEAHFGPESDDRRPSIPQTKQQLYDELVRAKEQLTNELAKGQDQNRRIYDLEQELSTAKDQLRDSHVHARNLHQDKQRLERQIHDLRTRVASTAASAAVAAAAGAAQITNGGIGGGRVSVQSIGTGHNSSNAGASDAASDWFGRATGAALGGGSGGANSGNAGLRELKLGRSKSTPTQASASSTASNVAGRDNTLSVHGAVGGKRSSSLMRAQPRRGSEFSVTSASGNSGNGDGNGSGNNGNMEQQQEALVLELVQAKTSEAVARQEAEEARQKLESLRKALGLSPNDLASILHISHVSGTSAAASSAASAAMGILGRLTATMSEGGNAGGNNSSSKSNTQAAPSANTSAATAASSGYGGFFGWRR